MRECISLEARSEHFGKAAAAHKNRIVICAGTGCMANGSMKIYERFIELVTARGITYDVAMEKEEGSDLALAMSGCQGFCQMGPLVTVFPQGVLYVNVKADDVEEIVDKTLIGGEIVERLLYRLPADGTTIAEEKDTILCAPEEAFARTLRKHRRELHRRIYQPRRVFHGAQGRTGNER